MKLNICCIPINGGKNNSGRQCILGYSVWRRNDDTFLDPTNGTWNNIQIIGTLQEQGRSNEHAQFHNMPGMKGCYLPEFPVNYGDEPLDGEYTILYHDRESDQRIVSVDTQRFDQARAVTPSKRIPFWWLVAIIGGTALGLRR